MVYPDGFAVAVEHAYGVVGFACNERHALKFVCVVEQAFALRFNLFFLLGDFLVCLLKYFVVARFLQERPCQHECEETANH